MERTAPARDAINWTLNEVAEHLGYADPGFTARTYDELARRATLLAPRVAAVLEGGYNLETLPDLVGAALEGFAAQ